MVCFQFRISTVNTTTYFGTTLTDEKCASDRRSLNSRRSRFAFHRFFKITFRFVWHVKWLCAFVRHKMLSHIVLWRSSENDYRNLWHCVPFVFVFIYDICKVVHSIVAVRYALGCCDLSPISHLISCMSVCVCLGYRNERAYFSRFFESYFCQFSLALGDDHVDCRNQIYEPV